MTPPWNKFELFLTFDPLTTGQTKRSLWKLFDDGHWPTHWHGQFYCWRLFKIWSLLKQNLNISDIWPLTTGWQRGHNEHFLMVDTDQHTGIVSFLVEGFLKLTFQQWPQMTQTWPPIENSWTLGMNLWPRISSPKFHQNLLNLLEEAVWTYLSNDPMTPWWPLSPNS